jgi:hypothetical protein
MKNRKFPRLVLALSFAVLTSAGAQWALAADAPAAAALQADPEQAFVAFAQRLKLTPTQQTQIKPLFEARNQKIKAIFDKHSGDTSRMGKMQAMREAKGVQEDFSGKLKPLLTSDQQTELEAMRAEGRAKAEELYEARKGGGEQRH